MPDLPLSTVFRERCPAAAATWPDDAELEAALRALFAEGERAWPGLALSAEAYVAHLAGRRALPPRLAGVRGADLYLACACVGRVRGAVEAFDRALLVGVGAALSRLRPSPAFVDEVRQVVREKLFVGTGGAAPKIHEYDGQGALESWVRVVALRAAVDLQRRTGVVADGAGREDPASSHPEPRYVKQRYKQAFNDAVRGAFLSLDAEQRELLRLRFVEGLTQHEVAAKLGIHRATVVRRTDAAREELTSRTRRFLRAELGANDAELESLAGDMASQIDLSLPGLLEAR